MRFPPSSRTRPIYGSSDRTAYHTPPCMVHVSNNPYLMELRGAGGRPRLDTGKLGIVTVELSSPAGVTDMLARAALGLLNTSPDFSAWTGTRFEVDSDRPIAAGVDGEAEELHAPAVFEIQPGHCRCGFRLAAVGRLASRVRATGTAGRGGIAATSISPVDHWRPLHHR